MDDLQENLLFDLVKDTQLEGELSRPAISSTIENPLCGDVVTLFLESDESGFIKNIRFKVKGCFLCRASAAALAERVDGISKSDAIQVIEKFHSEFMSHEKSTDESPVFQQLHKLRQYPTRVKCVLLAFEALEKLVR
jgi:nitrogen fixation NifU-like protein